MSDSSSGNAIPDQKKFYHSLQLVIEGFFSNETWKYFQREQVDTIIGNTEGRLVHGYKSSNPGRIKEFFDFFTIVEGRGYYILGCSFTELTPLLKKEVDVFLQSLAFEGKNYLNGN